MCGGINSLHVVSRSTQGGVVLRTALGGVGSNGVRTAGCSREVPTGLGTVHKVKFGDG